MDIFQFTRELMETESVTWNEGAAGRWLRDYLSSAGFEVTTQPVTEDRVNVYARLGDPLVTFSSHMDTVPPFIGFTEDEQNIYGRGACDAKGVVAAQVFAAQRLKDEGLTDIGLLYVVGEEDGSDGAKVANAISNRNRFLINGEPTESRQAIATKGALRVVIEAKGRTAHSAYPELGESAIEKLLDILNDIRRADWPANAELGPTTYNIGTITGGRRPNVVADFAASEVMFRTITQPDELYEQIVEVVGGRAEIKRGFSLPPIHTHTVQGIDIPTSVVRFGTDIPCLSNWGTPMLFGPGSIHDAHTAHEYIAKKDLLAAVDTYAQMARTLLAS
ncbi:MAG TPA: M20/M25/M40 family metallo-hydrolase [Blastocatellia bacterium]|nr:M20/M25/M40 family metallo-hydrolase [Blastocatellia bacterium]HMV85845.1 M20/M25/M40 family metallo-hydrolase [Blastocatellia bacterium]HMX24765.1 M20/M25/M40 family metallo-hydrolase [Blastocatellia bacterium]HMZ19200.1 M20/M25/M40 family metallo-hydrolase [Blastocatellia bacterium]HNG33399.1 M20/M25/M40 family metallo-hydrolase [Blastocatellia bacterium]